MSIQGSMADRMTLFVTLILAIGVPFRTAARQDTTPATETRASVQLIQLQDALDRARKNDAQYLAAAGDAKNAREDRLQARAAMLPSRNLVRHGSVADHNAGDSILFDAPRAVIYVMSSASRLRKAIVIVL